MDVNEFAQVVLAQTRERLAKHFSQQQADAEEVEVIPGRVYTKVNLGTVWRGHVGQGKFMVENETGRIYGIKAYGKVHKGHFYGTLDTVGEWYWGDYAPVRRPAPAKSAQTAPEGIDPMRIVRNTNGIVQVYRTPAAGFSADVSPIGAYQLHHDGWHTYAPDGSSRGDWATEVEAYDAIVANDGRYTRGGEQLQV